MLRLTFAVLFSSLLSLTSQAETFIIGAQNIQYYPHYDFSQENDKGLAWAILEAYADQSGHELIYHDMPIKRLQLEMRKGNVDFVYPDNPKWYNQIVPASEKYFSAPLTRALGGTIVNPNDVGKGIDRIQRLSIPLGFTPVNWQQRVDLKQTRLVPVSDTLSALYLLKKDRVDAANLEYSVTQYLTLTSPQYGPFTLDPALPYDNVGFMLSTINHPAVLTDINTFIRTHGELIDSLKQKYNLRDPEIILKELRERFYP
ncbi:transporter substrate-binding domain-containing protein [Alteromonas antoniana]|uniref:transporter substrate-binding domain-containing protein n=1 Tax=Alteromonas antoniana TaxID=2803813 RepID=UPI001C479145|nr:transporter substrate-binding domain-containing protein [Alteromonas antoniana]